MNLDYSVKGAKTRNTRTGKMPTGIHTKVQFQPTVVEDKYIAFKWEDPQSKQYQDKRIYFPDHSNYLPSRRKDKNTGDYIETQEQANQREIDDKIRDMADYLEMCYTPQEVEEKVEGKTFEALCNIVAKMLNDKREDFYVNLKVIPTSDLQYTEVPRFQGGYIELWKEDLPSMLQFNAYELDRINALASPAPASEETVVKPNLFNVS